MIAPQKHTRIEPENVDVMAEGLGVGLHRLGGLRYSDHWGWRYRVRVRDGWTRVDLHPPDVELALRPVTEDERRLTETIRGLPAEECKARPLRGAGDNACFENAAAYCERHPGAEVVLGWDRGDAEIFFLHAVVRHMGRLRCVGRAGCRLFAPAQKGMELISVRVDPDGLRARAVAWLRGEGPPPETIRRYLRHS